MGQFFFDESIHERGGFILGAFVYAPRSVGSHIDRELRRHGLSPGRDEFKSSRRMDSAPALIRLRSSLFNIVFHQTRIAVLICPANKRAELWREALHTLKRLIAVNALADASHDAYFDEGIVPSVAAAGTLAERLGLNAGCSCHFEQDSKLVRGLQLADLVAHTCSIMLLQRQGIAQKVVKVGPNSGYDPNLEVDLGWALWTSLRYSFFHRGNDFTVDDDPTDFMTVNVSDVGLFIAPSCDAELTAAAESTFGKCYLGCIH